jgi:hypothetical protein
MNIGWIFPLNNGGELTGFNNGAMDHFKGDRIASVVRETIQNSLDACDDKSKPVEVAFTIDSVPSKEMKEIRELRSPLELARRTLISQQGVEARARKFYDNAIELTISQKIEVLGVHDFNTKGLGGPTEDKLNEKHEAWLALVKGAGLSVKNQVDSGGSFGHGSKAPVAASQLRSVFYYTEIKKGKGIERRYQGKSILQSHHNENGAMTQGTGYYGFTNKSASPLLNDDIPAWPTKLRSKVGKGCGTSIYVPYAYLPDDVTETWSDMKLAIIANFYYAILKGALVVHLGSSEVLTSKNISDQLRNLLLLIKNGAYKKIDNDSILAGLDSARTILAPTDSGEFVSQEFGEIKWFIRTSEEIETKAVGLVRNGMLITRTAIKLRANSFSGTKPFDLLISIEGLTGSSMMKSIENPEHNNIQFERIDDKVERKEVARKYDSFVLEVKELVQRLAAQEIEEEISISDLDDLFGGSKFDNSRSVKGRQMSELVIGKIKKSKLQEGAETDVPDPDTLQPGRGVSGGDGKITQHGGKIPDPNGEKDVEGVKLTGRQVRDFRVVSRPTGRNTVKIFFTPVVKGEYLLRIFRSGETEREPITLRPVDEKEWTTAIPLKALNLKSRVCIEVEISSDDFKYALEGVMTSAN